MKSERPMPLLNGIKVALPLSDGIKVALPLLHGNEVALPLSFEYKGACE